MNSLSLPVPERPAIFLLFFALLSAALLPVWEAAGPVYSLVLSWLVRGGCTLIGLPDSLGTASWGAAAINPGLVAGIALFGATPRRAWKWKLIWISILVLALTLAHTVLLVAQVHAVVGSMSDQAESLRPWLATAPLEPANPTASGTLHSMWNWISPMATIGLWLTAGRR